MTSRFETPGFGLTVEAHRALAVGDGAHDLLRRHGRVVEQPQHAGTTPPTSTSSRRVLQVEMRAVSCWITGIGTRERLAVAAVEPLGQVARQLDVLLLVVAHRHDVGLVQQDVGRHQHRVGEQPDRGRRPARTAATCP